jgi:hypothetical protein
MCSTGRRRNGVAFSVGTEISDGSGCAGYRGARLIHHCAGYLAGFNLCVQRGTDDDA